MQLALSPDPSLPSLLAGLVVLAYLAAGEPVLGLTVYRRLERTRAGDPLALVRMFRLTVVTEWALAAVVLALVALDPGIRGTDVGLAWPSGPGAATVAGAVLAASGGVVLGAVAVRRAAARGRPVPGRDAVAAMLPRTRTERRWALAVAITAGICEEVVHRGFLIMLGVALGLPVLVAAGAALAVFTVAHVYQGPAGTAGVALLGILFTGVYVLSGSLLPGIWLHALVDARGLLLIPPPGDGGGGYPAGDDAGGGR